jgi:dipeptidyl aminopeptidase/acylaminoacyl peptidase
MSTTTPTRRSATAALLLVAVTFAVSARPALATPKPTVTEISIAYRAFDGRLRHAAVLLPQWYGPKRHPALPLVISPHGRGLDGLANARRWGNLPALGGGFIVVNPDGEGQHLDGRFSWGAPGQIDDLARMPELVRAALPWLRVDPRRIFAVGGSMGGEETLLLVARHPRLLAGAVAVDPVADLARQFRSSEGTRGTELRRLARAEVGGTPSTDASAFATRSPITYAAAIAASGVPLQIWWTRTDRIVVHSELQSGRLVTRLRHLDPRAPLRVVVGDWRHTAVMRAERSLPAMLAGLGLLQG